MRKDTHPVYHAQATIQCACGNSITVGSTQQSIDIEVCSACHPFYTGEKRGAVRGGRVERFQSHLQKKEEFQTKKQPAPSSSKKKTKPSTPKSKKQSPATSKSRAVKSSAQKAKKQSPK
ncbi:MAG: 50S ribosomal protein L31 [Candidatus Spechtbacteria bacterium SB0662_bin_43]|uniref:50S ribosomal protein L31 n=1 Tax=Candidatus Spechtbacteria bacterium SB0662_bin_43 TaxID=2604897 RepID=A0A845DAM4_9BACT|nr:50S ribosomal protein L31 [Candidatus Spechtbacteria bacterium SB0662_bin_43]